MTTKTKSYPKAIDEARANVTRRESALREIPLPDTSRVDAIQHRLSAIDHEIANDDRANLSKLEDERRQLAQEVAALRAQPADHEARRRVHRGGIQQAREVLADVSAAHIVGITDDRMRSVAALLRQAYGELKAADQERRATAGELGVAVPNDQRFMSVQGLLEAMRRVEGNRHAAATLDGGTFEMTRLS